MFNLNDFMNKGIIQILDTARRFYINNRPGQAFVLRIIPALKKSADARKKQEQQGIHIPPFLIASIASSCNLHCAGCYARANGSLHSRESDAKDMAAPNWEQVFSQASNLGISFILLAGGEPLIRRDVIDIAAKYNNIIFPIFTNGTLIDDSYLSLFHSHRNLIPVLSLEGNAQATDARRGIGVGALLAEASEKLNNQGILYGASITVTTDNLEEVTEKNFVQNLRESGCGLVVYVEYVPAQEGTDDLVLGDLDLARLNERVQLLRSDGENKGLVLISFPGDEDAMGGCLAAGRGFFHINASGGAEPCPFSPFSALNVKQDSLLTILQSPFFEKVRRISASQALSHKGGCTLFEHEEDVRQVLG